VPALVGFDQRSQHAEPLSFGGLGLDPHQRLDLAEGRSIVLFGLIGLTSIRFLLICLEVSTDEIEIASYGERPSGSGPYIPYKNFSPA
jgi:hypothetical protein